MFHEFRKYLQELRDQYGQFSWADVVAILLLIIGLFALFDGIAKRMR
jgi:ABC-type phosphate/phosphonate transport system permease subunit